MPCIWNKNKRLQKTLIFVYNNKKKKKKEIYTLDNSKIMLHHFTNVGLEEGGINWRFERVLMEAKERERVECAFRV